VNPPRRHKVTPLKKATHMVTRDVSLSMKIWQFELCVFEKVFEVNC